MLGEHQKQNAALAITALIELNEQGLIELDFNKNDSNGIESVRWTGRIEQVHDKPLIILDGAHNSEEAARSQIDTIKQYHDKEKVDILFSAINQNRFNQMVKHLSLIAHTFYALILILPRSVNVNKIRKHPQNDVIQLVICTLNL